MSGTVLFYQCKACLTHVPPTSKWDRHLSKCLSNRKDLQQGFIPKPVGFRLVTFNEVKIILERTEYDRKTEIEQGKISQPKRRGRMSGTAHSKLENIQLKLGMDLKNGEDNNQNGENEGRVYRKSHLMSNQKIKEICADILKESRETVSDKVASPFSSSSMAKKISGSKRKRRRPRKDSSSSKISSDNEESDESSKESKKKRVRKDKSLEVRKYSINCDLCPGKFSTSFELKAHLGIHNGKRPLIYCCVCGRAFNKRDSLNAHFLQHEAAEAREEKFNLLQPWSEDLIRQLRSLNLPSCLGGKQTCKFCLLSHHSYHSYITHIREEHSDPPEAYQFPCKFEKCTEKFWSIRRLLEHAKNVHPREFLGKMTWRRMTKGIFTGRLVVPKDEQGNPLWKQRVFEPKPEDKIRKPAATKYSKKIKRFPSSSVRTLAYKSSKEDDWERKNRNSVNHVKRTKKLKTVPTLRDYIPPEVKIEVESVNLHSETHDELEGDTTKDGNIYVIKKEFSQPKALKPEIVSSLGDDNIDESNLDLFMEFQNSTRIEPEQDNPESGPSEDIEFEAHLFGIIKDEI